MKSNISQNRLNLRKNHTIVFAYLKSNQQKPSTHRQGSFFQSIFFILLMLMLHIYFFNSQWVAIFINKFFSFNFARLSILNFSENTRKRSLFSSVTGQRVCFLSIELQKSRRSEGVYDSLCEKSFFVGTVISIQTSKRLPTIRGICSISRET